MRWLLNELWLFFSFFHTIDFLFYKNVKFIIYQSYAVIIKTVKNSNLDPVAELIRKKKA